MLVSQKGVLRLPGDGLTDRLGSPDTVAPEIVVPALGAAVVPHAQVGTKYSTPVDMWSAGAVDARKR